MLDTDTTLAHLAADLAEKRARINYLLAEVEVLRKEIDEATHELDAIVTENKYLREVIGRLSDTDTPEPGEVSPYRGRWKRTEEENERAREHYTDGTIWHENGAYHPPVEGVHRH